MDTRQRILAAAVDAYSQHGFRGTTTRRVAARAGVNEVTIFRLFGSKQALLADALRSSLGSTRLAPLPTDPGHPAADLTAWTEACLTSLGPQSRLLRACIGDGEAPPEVSGAVVALQKSAFAELLGYLERMRSAGLVRSSVDLRTAATMLTATILTDAIRRAVAAEDYPPQEQAAASYVAVILTALGASVRRVVESPSVRAPAPPSMPDATGA